MKVDSEEVDEYPYMPVIYIRCDSEPRVRIDLEKGIIELKEKPRWISVPISKVEWQTFLKALHILDMRGKLDRMRELALLN